MNENRAPLSLGVLSLLVFTLSFSCHAAPPKGASLEGSREVGQAAPAFELASLSGATVKLADQKGKVVLLDFWATWCKPCETQARIVEDVHRELAGKEVAIFALNSGEDKETVERYVAKKPFGYPVVLDPEDSLGVSLQIAALPAVLIVGKDGKVAFFREGIVDGPTLREELRKAGV